MPPAKKATLALRGRVAVSKPRRVSSEAQRVGVVMAVVKELGGAESGQADQIMRVDVEFGVSEQ